MDALEHELRTMIEDIIDRVATLEATDLEKDETISELIVDVEEANREVRTLRRELEELALDVEGIDNAVRDLETGNMNK